MDVQGSQFHLIHGLGDWGRCSDGVTGQPLAAVWEEEAVSPPSLVHSSLEYDQGLGALRLRHDLPLFRRAGRTVPLDPVGPAWGRARRLRQLVLDRRRPGQHPLAAGGRRRLGALVVGGPAQRVVRRRRAVGLRLVPAATAGRP